MKHLMFALFSVFASACAVPDAAPAADPIGPIDPIEASTEQSIETSIGVPNTVDPQVCNDQHAACALDCLDLVGNAKGACLRICLKELKDCMAGH